MYCSRLWDFKLFRDKKAFVTVTRVLLSSSCNHVFKRWNLTETKISRNISEKRDLRIAARQFSCPGCPRPGSGRPGWGPWPTEENKNKVAFIIGRVRSRHSDGAHLSLVLRPGSFTLWLAELLLYFVVQQRLVLMKRHYLVFAGI